MSSDSQKLARRNRELTILNEIAAALNEEVDLNAALHTALDKVADLLQLRTGWIWLLAENDEEVAYLAAEQNLPPALRQNPRRMEGSCYCLDTFRAGDLSGAANVNVVGCSRLSGLVDGTDGLRYHTSVPLYASYGTRLGVLNVAGANWRELSAADLRLLHTIGDLLSITIERARLFARSRQIGASEERSRLAREIHDTLGQNLAAITLQLETADALLESGVDAGDVWPIIKKTLALSRSGLLEARRSVLDLRAVPLEGRSLHDALADLSQEFQEQTGIPIAYRTAGANHPLPVRVEVALYRVVQEALANIERHAGAHQAQIDLAVTPAQLALTIADDGRGFEADSMPDGRYGLVGINERIHLLGGALDLQSSLAAGTRLHVTVPLGEIEDRG
jgi:two-component system, NarL family, sensor kinase